MPFLKSWGATLWENQQVCIVYLLVAFFVGCFLCWLFSFFCFRSLLSLDRFDNHDSFAVNRIEPVQRKSYNVGVRLLFAVCYLFPIALL